MKAQHPQIIGESERRLVLIIDTREKKPLEFGHLAFERGALKTGDYAIKGCDTFRVERKSLADLANCIRADRDRFERQCARLAEYNDSHLLIEGSDKELAYLLKINRINLSQADNTLKALRSRYGFNIHHVPTPAAAALRVETLAVAAWHNAARDQGLRFPFPAWAECSIVPRCGETKTAEQVLKKMLEWNMLPPSFFR